MKANKSLEDKTQPPLHHQPQAELNEKEELQYRADKITNEYIKGKKLDLDIVNIEDQPSNKHLFFY